MGVKSYVGNQGKPQWSAFAYSRSRVVAGLKIEKERTGIDSEREAQTVYKQLQRECEREVLLKETQGSSWGAVLEAWSKSVEQGSTSVATRMDSIAAAYNHTGQWTRLPAAGIAPIDIKNLLAQLKEQGRSYVFIKQMKNLLGRIFLFGIESRLIRGLDHAPTIGIQLGRPEEKKPEILTLTEIRKLLTSAKEMNHPWYFHWALALLTGMRSGELYALLWSDIDWENSAITVSKSYNNRFNVIKSTKAGHWRTVPISAELRSMLLEVRAQAAGRAHVLSRPRLWQMGMQAQELRRFCEGVGLPSIRFHALRACFATQLIRNGVPPIQIQKICGWRDLKTMQRYIRMAGIEVDGATDGLKIMPEPQIAAKVVNLFAHGSDPLPAE